MKTKKKSNRKKKKIKDPPFAKSINKGSDATEGLINYHYQHYSNITDYISYLYQSNKKYQNIYFINCTLIFNQHKKTILPKYISKKHLKEQILTGTDKRFIPIILETIITGKNHANIIIIDNNKKNIELFEPHGNRGDESSLHNIKKSYKIKKDKVKIFFKNILPKYKFISVADKLKQKHRLQSRYDSNSGYCITWSLLYFHYRILNPNISYNRIIHYIDKKIKLNDLLRYAKNVEDTLKSI
jgi:hypothetical protein